MLVKEKKKTKKKTGPSGGCGVRARQAERKRKLDSQRAVINFREEKVGEKE